MSVPDRGNHPNRKATFQCFECGKNAPIHEAGVDGVCNACFDDRYALDGGYYECTHVKADDSGMCDYWAQGNNKAQRRNDLDRHFAEDPEHNEDPNSRYTDEDEASNFHSSFAPSDREEDEFHANKDRDREEPKRPYGKSE